MADQYLVSARKYRPQTFDTVVGQEHITTTLKNAIRQQQLAHAYLFCGPRGVGKTTCARILAKTINCEAPTPEMEACGTCATCRSFADNSSFNVFELDAASNNSVDDIRELVSQVRFAPQQGRYKIYIIDEVHMLSASAFNAFLKTLEEPPPYAIFILATTEKHKILPTILSRCQIFDFKRITTGSTVAHLQGVATKEGMHAEEAALHVIARKSEGCMRDSLSMLDRIASFTSGNLTYAATMEHLAMLDADFYFRLVDALLSQDVSGTLLHLDDVLNRGFEGDAILAGLSEHLRSLLLCKDGRMAKLLDVPAEHKPLFFEKARQAPPSYLMSALALLNDTELEYRNASNKRLHTEVCLIRLCYLAQPGSDEAVQKKSFDGGVAATTPPAAPQPPVQAAPPVVPAAAPAPAAVPRADTAPPATPPVPQPPAPVAQAPAAAPPVAVPPPQKAAPAGPSRRVSLDLLQNLSNAGPKAAAERKDMTPELAQSVLDRYRDRLRDENASVLHAQFVQIQVEVLAPDEVRLVCQTDMAEEYCKSERDRLLEAFQQAAGALVRVTTEVRADPNAPEPERILSKQEVYEELARKNPPLATLKEGLNLQIEF